MVEASLGPCTRSQGDAGGSSAEARPAAIN
jgi:hypothetical protein